jgi:hypothetical protein
MRWYLTGYLPTYHIFSLGESFTALFCISQKQCDSDSKTKLDRMLNIYGRRLKSWIWVWVSQDISPSIIIFIWVKHWFSSLCYIMLNFLETCILHSKTNERTRLNVWKVLQLLEVSMYFTVILPIYNHFYLGENFI